jgi:hypothetical protein
VAGADEVEGDDGVTYDGVVDVVLLLLGWFGCRCWSIAIAPVMKSCQISAG